MISMMAMNATGDTGSGVVPAQKGEKAFTLEDRTSVATTTATWWQRTAGAHGGK